MPLDKWQFKFWESQRREYGALQRPCPACADMGALMVDVQPSHILYEELKNRVFHCLCRIEEVFRRRMDEIIADSGNVPERAKSMTFEDFANCAHATAPVAFMSDIARGELTADVDGNVRAGVLLYGNTGSGKSTLAYIAMRERMTLGHQCGWIGYRRFMQRVKDTYNEGWGGPTRSQMVDAVAQLPFLVIDDLGAGGEFDQRGVPLRATEHSVGIVLDILDYRTPRQLPTVITSNLDVAAIGTHFGDRIESRIEELCLPIPMTGVDFRRARHPHLAVVK